MAARKNKSSKKKKTTASSAADYCHQTAAELFRWSTSLYFCNGVRIRYGDREYYVRLMAAKAMMQRQQPWLLLPRRNSLTAPHLWNMTSRFKTCTKNAGVKAMCVPVWRYNKNKNAVL